MADQQFSSTSYTYDVFISFRGWDTGNGFAGHLSRALNERGIQIYLDDNGRSKGDEIQSATFKAIQVSRIAIIVFSDNYAVSKFALEELAFMVDNFQQRDNLRFIFPVFYNIEPSHVRRQSGPFEAAFLYHEKRFHENREKVLRWKTALSQVANLPGWHFDGVEYEYQFFQKIVKEISRKLKLDHASLHVADYPVGLDSRLGEVLPHLELESNDVLTVGIYGIGGMGKTTLARAVYKTISDQFDASCFLSDIRESSNTQSLAHLQNILLSKMTGLEAIQLRDTSQGISEIKRRLYRKKVLLILDDVDKLEQMEALAGGLDWFGPGSRVVITTRDRHLLAFCGVERRYEVQELNRLDSLEFLSHKVFKQGFVDPKYKELLNRVVTYASGLPLALEVIGLSLSGKSVDEWKHALHQFERIPPTDILKILTVSFDALDEEVKNIFLDITCCFKGYALAHVEDILRARYGHDLKDHIKVLIDKSLITISLDGKVTIHPLIESMGREIVRMESPTDPGKRSRLWFSKDIFEVLENNTGTNKIEILHLDSTLVEDKVINWDGNAFKKMKNLRILIIRKCHFSQAPKYLPERLKVLEWWRYRSEELPSDFDFKKLVICKLPNMEFKSPELTEFLQISNVDPEVSQTSQRVTDVTPNVHEDAQDIPDGTPNDHEDFQNVPNVTTNVHEDAQDVPPNEPNPTTNVDEPNSNFDADTIWRIVGLVSCAFGLLCYAFSPAFNQLIGGWKTYKIVLYGVFSVVISAIMYHAKKISLPTEHVKYKPYVKFAVLMMISIYSFFYDRAVGGKPEILSVLSNAAFVLVSVSLSKLVKMSFEAIFSYFLGCLAIQLWTISKKFIPAAVIYGCPLFVIQSSSNSQSDVSNESQVIHSGSDSQTRPTDGDLDSTQEVDSGGQHGLTSGVQVNGRQVVHSDSDSQTGLTSGGQDIQSSSDLTLEVNIHVVEIPDEIQEVL